MKSIRLTLTVAALAALLFVFFFVPLPVSRVRQTGLVEVQPLAKVQIPVEIPAILELNHANPAGERNQHESRQRSVRSG